MAKDKYKAHWVSHSSISDFLKCPRLYYLRAVYKDPVTNHKITIVKPPLAMGQIIHDVIDEISKLPADKRFVKSPKERLVNLWNNIEGKKGGFKSKEEESIYKKRALTMIGRIEKYPGPLLNKAIKIKSENGLPYFWLSDEENIILCGKIDWIEYDQKSDSIHIIDFKTGKNEENDSSLQLPIYMLLASNLQKRKISKISYWYLNSKNKPTDMDIPDINNSYNKVLEVAKRMKLGKQINYFKCPKGGCYFCTPLERIINGEGEKVGISEYNQDIYFLKD